MFETSRHRLSALFVALFAASLVACAFEYKGEEQGRTNSGVNERKRGERDGDAEPTDVDDSEGYGEGDSEAGAWDHDASVPTDPPGDYDAGAYGRDAGAYGRDAGAYGRDAGRADAGGEW